MFDVLDNCNKKADTSPWRLRRAQVVALSKRLELSPTHCKDGSPGATVEDSVYKGGGWTNSIYCQTYCEHFDCSIRAAELGFPYMVYTRHHTVSRISVDVMLAYGTEDRARVFVPLGGIEFHGRISGAPEVWLPRTRRGPCIIKLAHEGAEWHGYCGYGRMGMGNLYAKNGKVHRAAVIPPRGREPDFDYVLPMFYFFVAEFDEVPTGERIRHSIGYVLQNNARPDAPVWPDQDRFTEYRVDANVGRLVASSITYRSPIWPRH